MSVVPKGLLSFLDIKNDAKYPQSLSDQLQGVFSLEQWYLETNSELQQGTTGAVAVSSIGITVPSGELWFVEELLGSFTAGAGVTGAGAVSFVFPDAANGSMFRMGDIVTWVANDEVRLKNDHAFFAPPGSSLGLYLQRIAGGTVTCLVRARVARFRT
jgi:hypothetical protein